MPGHLDAIRKNSLRGDLLLDQSKRSLYVNLKDRDATCVCCSATLAADSTCTSCDACSKRQCIDRSKMSIAQYKLLKGLENFTWICKPVYGLPKNVRVVPVISVCIKVFFP